jgi:hypothetical protein
MDSRIVVAQSTALAFATLFAPSPVSSAQVPRSYVATYEYSMGNKTARLNETLMLHDADPEPSVTLTSTAGQVLTTPTRFAPDGEIEGSSSDPSVLCYNMAAATLYAALHTPDRPAPVFVRVNNGTVAIPVALTASDAASDGSREFVGNGERTIAIRDGNGEDAVPAQMAVAARIRVVDGEIENVVFSEATAVGNASNIVNQQTCTLSPGTALPSAAAGTAVST